MFRKEPWTIENKKSSKKETTEKTGYKAILHGKKAEDLTGQRFGRLTVIKRVEDTVAYNGRHFVTFLCKCDCGNFKKVRSMYLKSGKVQSCGCLRTENIKKVAKKSMTERVEKEVQKRLKQELKKEKKKNKKSFSFKFFDWTIKIKN